VDESELWSVALVGRKEEKGTASGTKDQWGDDLHRGIVRLLKVDKILNIALDVVIGLLPQRGGKKKRSYAVNARGRYQTVSETRDRVNDFVGRSRTCTPADGECARRINGGGMQGREEQVLGVKFLEALLTTIFSCLLLLHEEGEGGEAPSG